MSIFSTKKLLISLILVMGIMLLGANSQVLAKSINKEMYIGATFEVDRQGATIKNLRGNSIKAEIVDSYVKDRYYTYNVIKVTAIKEGISYVDIAGDNYTITVRKNGTLTFKGATDSEVAKTVTDISNVIKADKDGYVTIPKTIPKREGYNFKYWLVYTNGRAGSTSYNPGDKVKVGEFDMVVVAQWKKVGKEYTITYDANGGNFSGGESILKVSQDYCLGEAPSRTGYKFLGWAENKEATEPDYKLAEELMKLEKTITLYAVWQEKAAIVLPPDQPIIQPDPKDELKKVDDINISNIEEMEEVSGLANGTTAMYDREGNVIGNINNGTKIIVLGKTQDGKYYKIKWKETDVYAHKNWVDATGKKAKQSGTSYGPNIRTGAGTGTVLGDLVAGQPFTSVSEGTGNYKKVSFEIEGYISTSKISVDEGSGATPGATPVNKAGKVKNDIEILNAYGRAIATINKDQKVTVIEELAAMGYYKIIWKVEGYAHKNYVNNGTTKGVGPNIRTAPNQQAEIIGDIKAGISVTIVEEEGNYYKITADIEGYIEKDEVTLEETSENKNTNMLGGLLGTLLNFAQQGFEMGRKLISSLGSEEGTGGLLTGLAKSLFGGLSENGETLKQTATTVITEGLKFIGNGFRLLLGGSRYTPQ